jgi:tRNA threonylcarbamoyladenosine biosynthesis protein TsaE
MATFISHSPAETEALGEAWGRAADTGAVFALSGELGAGKTQLVKGLARGLGITARVHSPTFNLINIYSGGRLTLFHLDLYRLESFEQILAAGLEEYLHPAGVAVVEWAERWFDLQNPLPEGVSRPSSVDSHVAIQRNTTDRGPRTTDHVSPLVQVRLEILSNTERRISYEDTGA